MRLKLLLATLMLTVAVSFISMDTPPVDPPDATEKAVLQAYSEQYNHNFGALMVHWWEGLVSIDTVVYPIEWLLSEPCGSGVVIIEDL